MAVNKYLTFVPYFTHSYEKRLFSGLGKFLISLNFTQNLKYPLDHSVYKYMKT
jgi:hypothetical protein